MGTASYAPLRPLRCKGVIGCLIKEGNKAEKKRDNVLKLRPFVPTHHRCLTSAVPSCSLLLYSRCGQPLPTTQTHTNIHLYLLKLPHTEQSHRHNNQNCIYTCTYCMYLSDAVSCVVLVAATHTSILTLHPLHHQLPDGA